MNFFKKTVDGFSPKSFLPGFDRCVCPQKNADSPTRQRLTRRMLLRIEIQLILFFRHIHIYRAGYRPGNPRIFLGARGGPEGSLGRRRKGGKGRKERGRKERRRKKGKKEEEERKKQKKEKRRKKGPYRGSKSP
jgi:hypothetical protein